MSEIAPSPTLSYASPAAPSRSFVGHAKLIGGLTLVSRITGLAREIVAGHYLGTGLVASAFTVAFTIPNLFRKLFGEGALSAAFIPLYSQAIRREEIAAASTSVEQPAIAPGAQSFAQVCGECTRSISPAIKSICTKPNGETDRDPSRPGHFR